MKVYEGLSSIDDSMRGAVLTVGNFDGVHLGHQRILRTSHALAHVSSAKVVAMTFEPHPLAVLRPDRAPRRLTPCDEKLRQLAQAGADAVVKLKADRETLSLSAEDFVRQVLVRQIHPSYIVEGHDFGFGHNRQGNIDTLWALSPKGGFQVHVVEPYRITLGPREHVIVSSTVIRDCLSRGEIEQAAACLGRPYALVGDVVHGEGQGTHLGYPTINLEVAEGQLIPGEGVYAGIAELGVARSRAGKQGTYDLAAPVRGHDAATVSLAAISLGHRPTLGGKKLVIEAFVLDKSGDWYGEHARLDFVKRVRDQRKFASRAELTDQIARDVEYVRRVVSLG
ncbi:MAG TPA: bifunctional riboflavin kinase/FAD synthetase [Phycisphaerae bacterium]|nr:bifunctional riboflavin kinase/FAD synthetase [Phycisphaerae bacterium]